MWALTCKDYSTGSRVCWRWWQTWRYSPPTHTAMWPSSRSPHRTFHLIPKSRCDKDRIHRQARATICHNFITKPKSHIRWEGFHMRRSVVFFSCRCYDEMLLCDENIRENPKEHRGDICGEAGGSSALFTWTNVSMSTSSLHACIQQAEGCGNTSRGKHQLQPSSINAMTYMHASQPMTIEELYVTLMCVWRLVLFGSTQGDRNRKRNCTRVNVSTDVTKDIKPLTERLQHFSIRLENICAAQLGRADICLR